MAQIDDLNNGTALMNDRVPASVRALINQFFATMDINDPAAGEILANGICSQDCIIAGVSQNFEGVEQIKGCRQNAWTGVKARKHVLTDFFTSEKHSNQFIVKGSADMKFTNGTDKTSEFVGQFTISQNERGEPRVQMYRVWLAPDIA